MRPSVRRTTASSQTITSGTWTRTTTCSSQCTTSTPMTTFRPTIAWCTSCVERAHRAHCFTLWWHRTPHWLKSWALSHSIHGHPHGAFSLTRSLPSSFSFPSCPSPSASSTTSCSLSSTTRSSWQVCATPPQKRVRAPWTPPTFTQWAGNLRNAVRRLCADNECTCFCEPIKGKSKTHKDELLSAHPQKLCLLGKELGPILNHKIIRSPTIQCRRNWSVFFVMVVCLEKTMERLNSVE